MREAIQRSASEQGGGVSSPARPPRSTTSRAAFHSLVTSWRPWSMRSALKRTSWVLDIIIIPKRRASAPAVSIRSIGSTPVPSDLLMRRPSAACTTEWM